MANPLHIAAQFLQSLGNRGDSLLVHINAKEAAKLKKAGGSGTVNPHTGLLQFDDGDGPGNDGSDGGAVGGGSATGGLGGGYGGFGEGVGQSRDAPADSGGRGSGMGGEVGGGHDLGVRDAFGGMLGGFGQPSTGSGFFDAGINNAVNNPVSTIAGLGLNAAVPGLGLVSGISGLLGGPTTQSALAAMAEHGTPSGSTIGGQSPGMDASGPGQAPAPTGVPGGSISPAALGQQTARAAQTPFTQNFQGYAPYDPAALMRAWAARQQGHGFFG